ncbi:hypothetical protein J5N97_025022 [Dioscorea zingiberensis]|uniref:Uncharacterized protein n=1 Tax=Dioscorea zingiberensis TaxID=325984 RepID=A0A9D5C832_9LILI|nr:hypothetical protein J5N97_025022 [Dioscorea zingiberensis]
MPPLRINRGSPPLLATLRWCAFITASGADDVIGPLLLKCSYPVACILPDVDHPPPQHLLTPSVCSFSELDLLSGRHVRHERLIVMMLMMMMYSFLHAEKEKKDEPSIQHFNSIHSG